MNFKLSYIFIPALALIALFLGKYLSDAGMVWYATLNLPKFTPPKWAFAMVWPIIYILVTLATIYIWEHYKKDKNFYYFIFLIIINGFLNVIWSLLFFYNKMILAALIDAILLEITVLILFTQLWKKSVWLGMCFLPYLIWGLFAIYLNFAIWLIN